MNQRTQALRVRATPWVSRRAALLLLTVAATNGLSETGGVAPLANVTFNQLSSPAGIVNQSTNVPAGTSVTTIAAPLTSSGQRFTRWEINGERAGDALGRALNPVRFTVLQPTWAVAYYVGETADTDTDGVLDWFELSFHGSLTNAAGTSDTDGDGFDLTAEHACDYHPALADAIVDGGVSRRRSVAARMILDANYYVCVEKSVPPVFAEKNSVVADGTVVTSAYCHGEASGYAYTFGYWAVGGVRQADSSGCALPQVRTPVMGDTVLTAHYFPTSGDTDADGVYDWYEWQYCGTTNFSGGSDADGDTLSLATEYEREHHPGMRDTQWDGGVSRRRSLGTTVNLAGYVPYTIRSVPPGFTAESRTVVTGTVVTTAHLRGENAGYTFAYWSVNGARQQDWLGTALHQVTFTVTGAVDAVAHYFPTGQDGDGDGVPDWYEWGVLGSTNQNAASDADGDGLDLRTEYLCEYSPLISNRVTDGGVSSRRSLSTALNLEVFPRVTDILCGGVPTNFFSMYPTNVTGRVFGANSHPALGDWDGDGDLDLWVGASGGRMAIFENQGSIRVANLVDQSARFAAMASVWQNVRNPAPALGNWNFDPAADLAVGGDTNVVRIVSSTKTFSGPHAPAVNYGLTVESASAIPALADMDGDGGTDLLVLLDDGTVDFYPFLGNPNAPFVAPPARKNILGVAVPHAAALSTGDVNHDGRTDVLVSDQTGRVWEFHQTGALTFALRSMIYGGTYDGFAQRLTIAAGDLDGDGDTDIVGGYRQGGLVYLHNPAPKLVVSPPSRTVMPGAAVDFAAAGATGTVTWAFVRNASGGTVDPSTGAYVAGAASGAIDIIEATGGGMRGRAYVNVIGADDVAGAGKAIVIAGSRGASDPVWPVTDYLADRAYNTLLYRAYSKTNIYYLSRDPAQDADGDGLPNDIDGQTTFANAEYAFTNWAVNLDRLFVYLVDHGEDVAGRGAFRLNAAERLPAATLDAWLDRMQDRYRNEVVVVLDCCYAGSFVDELTYTGAARRIVVAACGPSQPTYFVAGGLVSFSDAFFSGVLLGLDAADAFALARGAMGNYQSAMLDDDGSGDYRAGVDGAAAHAVRLGASFVAGKDLPQIGTVCDHQTVTGRAMVTLWAGDVMGAYPIERVWCLIVPPGHLANPDKPVTDLPALELRYNTGSRRYEVAHHGFDLTGTYLVRFHAEDIWGSVSLPRQTYVTQTGFRERAILVNGARTNAAVWAAADTITRHAYHTLRRRWLAPEAICFLSGRADPDVDGDGTNDIDDVAASASLAQAFTNFAVGAHKLTVCLVGEEATGTFRLGDKERLTAAALDAFLDAFQVSNPAAEVVTVLEFPGCGAFLPALSPPAGAERVCVTSCGAGKPCLWAAQGRLSFASAFFGEVFNGSAVGPAFDRAAGVIRSASGRQRQTAELDDDGNGCANETGRDGTLARTRYIGSAFMTGDDPWAVGEVMPDTVRDEPAPLWLWARHVTDMDAVSNVWCTVTPPSYDGAGALPELSLAWDEGAARYQAWYDGMVRTGVYVVTFLAADAVGEIAPPVQAVITRVDTDIDGDRLPDWWERSYFAGATNAAPDEDSDGDGQSNADEYATGTVPTDRGSRFAIRSCDSPGVTGRFSLRWDTVARRRYHVYATPDLLVPWPTGAIYSVDGDGAPHAFTNDTPASPCRLFRLSVELTE